MANDERDLLSDGFSASGPGLAAPPEMVKLPTWPIAGAEEEAALQRVLRSSRWWRGNGTEGDEFEREFAAFLGISHVRLVSSGAAAIEIALQALGIRPGDHVIVPACTFIATASAVLRLGAWPIPVDVDAETLCLTPAAFEAAITDRVKCVIPVHMAGQAVEIDRICEIARRHDILVLEDAAHAHGASWHGQMLGTFGDASIFSFQAGKLMTSGEGGLVATNNPDVAGQTFALHSCGRPKGDTDYEHLCVAGNYRATEFQAALLRPQLRRLPEQLRQRERQSDRFDARMASIPGIRPLSRRPGVTRHSHYMSMFWVDPQALGGQSTRELVAWLRGRGVLAYRCFPAVHQTKMFSEASLETVGATGRPDYRAIETPISSRAAREVIWFHHSILLGDDSLIEQVCELVSAGLQQPKTT